MIRPSSPHRVLLSSITSTELRKIIFPAKYVHDRVDFARQVEDWGFVDKQLCELVGRLRATGYRHILEVELRLMAVDDEPGDWDFTKFLLEFREKGVVTVIDATDGDRLLHSSTCNR